MFRSLPKRAVITWLLDLLGPPPPYPRRHFSKNWYARVHHRAPPGRGGAGRYRKPVASRARLGGRPDRAG
jgi:hypothetical protein